MARPQSPELRRSGTTPAFEPDSISSRLDAHTRPTASGESGPVPEENSPGHRPQRDQDQPDLDAFAARFSGRDLDDLPTETGLLAASARRSADSRIAAGHPLKRWALPLGGSVALAAALTIWVRRRRP